VPGQQRGRGHREHLIPPPPGDQKPFKGVPFNVGDRIEAEDYDIGGEGISFHDVDSANRGGKYRSDAVDIEVSSAGGYDVAYATAGEWLEYTIYVPSDGNYALDIATASYAFAGTFHIDIDGAPALGPITVPATGGWQKWQVLHAAGLKLTAGTHVMRLSFDSNGPSGSFANIDYLKLTPAPAPGVMLTINQTFPKGAALARWLNGPAVNASPTLGQITVNGSEHSVTAIIPLTEPNQPPKRNRAAVYKEKPTPASMATQNDIIGS